MIKIINFLISIISNTKFFCYLIIYFIFLLILGTIVQKNMGLLYAQKTYFTSYIILVKGIIPLPGGFLIFIITALSLCSKIYINKLKKNIGTLTIHLGSLLLILSGLTTNIYTKEGTLSIYKNEKSNKYTSNDIIKIQITKNKEQLSLKINKKYILDKKLLPFIIKINKIHQEKIKKNNISINITNNKNTFLNIITKNKKYLISEKQFTQTFKYKNNKYICYLKNKNHKFPFYINLKKFKKKNYPGTNTANKFKSIIIIIDNNKFLKKKIKMNNPTKHKEHTFYQTAFIEKEKIKATILTVIKNKFSFFPYISSTIIFIGILIHLITKRKNIC